MKLVSVSATLFIVLGGTPIVASAQQGPTTLTSAERWIDEDTTGLTEIRVTSLLPFALLGTWNAILAEDTVVNGLPCLAGEQVRFEYGNLSACTVSATWHYSGVDVPAGSRVQLYPDEAIATVFSVEPDGSMGVGATFVEPGEVAVFHRSDRDLQYIIVEAELSAPEGRVVCHSGHPDDTVLLHPDRAIARCHLAEEYVTERGTVPVSSVVAFNVIGELTQIILHRDMTYGGELYASGSTVEIVGEGQIVSARLSHIVPVGMSVTDPFWRVSDGFYYGYPVHEVFPEP